MRTVVRRMTSTLVAALLVIALLGVATLFWLVRQNGWTIQTVATGSMEPTVPTGSVILSRPVEPDTIRVGDVIVFTSPTGSTVSTGTDGAFESRTAMAITHRVTAIEGEPGQPEFRTRGDANADEDPWLLEAGAVTARYVGHVPYVGTVLSRPDLRRWLYLTVAAAGVVVIIGESRTILGELRRRREPAGAPLA